MKTTEQVIRIIEGIVDRAKEANMREIVFNNLIVAQAHPDIQYIYWEFWNDNPKEANSNDNLRQI